MKKGLIILMAVLVLAMAGAVYGYYGLCYDHCENGMYYYDGNVQSDSSCRFSMVKCAEGCDGDECKNVQYRVLRMEIPSHERAHVSSEHNFNFRDLAQRTCPDTCYGGALYYQGVLNPSSGRCTYKYQPCSYGCDIRRAQCATRMTYYPSRRQVMQYEFPDPLWTPQAPRTVIYAPYQVPRTGRSTIIGQNVVLSIRGR